MSNLILPPVSTVVGARLLYAEMFAFVRSVPGVICKDTTDLTQAWHITFFKKQASNVGSFNEVNIIENSESCRSVDQGQGSRLTNVM